MYYERGDVRSYALISASMVRPVRIYKPSIEGQTYMFNRVSKCCKEKNRKDKVLVYITRFSVQTLLISMGELKF